MNIKLIEDKKVQVDMIDSLKEIIDSFSKNVSNKITSPATNDLYAVHPSTKLLEGDKKAEFHSVTQKLIFVAKRCIPDLETAVDLLTTRVTKSTMQDWWKLKRVLKYIMTTKN